MGELIDLNSRGVIADSDLPGTIARDSEYIAGDAQTQAWAEGRFEYRALRFSKTLDGPFSISSSAWFSLGSLPGLSLGTQGEPSFIDIGLCFLFDTRYPWQQLVCGGSLSLIWWQSAVTADTGIRIPIEQHNESGFYINIRGSQPVPGAPAGQNQGENRRLEIKSENLILIPSGGQLKIVVVKRI